MPCISLVFTVHEEQGLANARALHAILHQIQPEVVFLEVPEAAFGDLYLSRRQRNLEADAVHSFLGDSPQVTLVPIDLPTPSREFFEDHEQLRMRVRAESPDYRRLVGLDRDRVRAYGFAYLNSDYSSQHWSDVRGEIRSAIERIGESRLGEIQETWDRTNECRESAMLENMRRYCLRNHFERAAFLVGAAHRRGFIERLTAQSEIDWALWGADGVA